MEAIANSKGCEASRSRQGYAQAYATNGFFITLLGKGKVWGGSGERGKGWIHCVGVLQSEVCGVCFRELGFVFK